LLPMLRYRLLALFPFLSRWLEMTSATACCGVCPTCIGAAAGSLLLPLVVRDAGARPDASRPAP
jgi:hypothetical protein